MTTTVYRVQDADGRGPWRPGFSHVWSEDRPDKDNLPPWFAEFGPVHKQVLYGCHCGSACLTETQLRRWVSPAEYRKLLALGFRAYSIPADRVLARSAVQCFIETARPLREIGTPFDLYP